MDKGTTTYTAIVIFNGVEYTDTLDVEDIESIGHNYDEPVFMWNDDGSNCVAMLVCQNNSTHIYVFGKDNVAITSAVITEATCLNKGTTAYTATVTYNGTEYTDTLEVEDIAATGHTLTHVEAVEATETTVGNMEYWYCADCGKYFSDEDGTIEIGYEDTIVKATADTSEVPLTSKESTDNTDSTSSKVTTNESNKKC